MKIYRVLIIVIALITIISLNYYVQAIGFATGVGTENFNVDGNNVNSKILIKEAMELYPLCGYTSVRRIMDPSYDLLVSNLMAEVQVFCTHGSIDSIRFKSPTGIYFGKSLISGGKEMIGIHDIAKNCWSNNTILVTYISCNTAGENGIADPENNSLTYRTVQPGGVNVALGFKKEISYSTAEVWSAYYHMKLSDGEGVENAARYASSFSYTDNKINSWHLVYDGSKVTSNMKIGKYNPQNADLMSIDSSYEKSKMGLRENKSVKEFVFNDSMNNQIVSELKNVDNDFCEENYEINRQIAQITDTSTGAEKKIEYVNAILKIGDYYTNSGYTIEIVDGKEATIYDNNIDKEKQKNALINKKEFIANLDDNKILNIKEEARNKINMKYKKIEKTEDINISDESVKYFYDIEKDKKYILIDIKSEVSDLMGGTDIAIDTLKYEI